MAAADKGLRVEDVEALMAAMSKTGTSALEWQGLRLSRVSERREMSPVASIAPPMGTDAGPKVTAQDAYAAVQKARLQAQSSAEARLASNRARTEGARNRALERAAAATPLAQAVKGVYEAAKASAPPSETGV